MEKRNNLGIHRRIQILSLLVQETVVAWEKFCFAVLHDVIRKEGKQS